MEPITLATALAAIVGLLGQFKAERTEASDNEYRSFVDWLATRRHESVVTALDENHLLASSVRRLLEGNHSEVVTKLNELTMLVVGVASRLDEFKEVAAVASVHGADRALYERFMESFSSDSDAVFLLQKQNFEATYPKHYTTPVYEFITFWGAAEYRFVDDEIEEAKERLRTTFTEFYSAQSAGAGIAAKDSKRLTLIPDEYEVDHGRPQWLLDRIANVTRLAEEADEALQSFVFLCRSKLQV